jgi:serine/threonine protein kinase
MKIGRYEVIRKIATGGMAEVFLAKVAGPLGFEKTLVVKRILPHLADQPAFVEMFLAEAKLVAQLNHPHIVQIFDFGEADGAYFLAMEYIEGPNLRTLLKRARELETPLPLAVYAKMVASACEGMAYAHDFRDPTTGQPLGLIHRDISPDNILVSRQGAVKVADFGIAKATGHGPQTRDGTLKGKLTYMAPEQIRGAKLDRRADVYALGIVLYELLTQRKPFDATTDAAIMQSILFEPFIPAVERRPDLPSSIQHILDRALAKNREDRYPDCLAFQADLDRFVLSIGEPLGSLHIARAVTQLEPSTERAGLVAASQAAPKPEAVEGAGGALQAQGDAEAAKASEQPTLTTDALRTINEIKTVSERPKRRESEAPPVLEVVALDEANVFEASLLARRRTQVVGLLIAIPLILGGLGIAIYTPGTKPAQSSSSMNESSFQPEQQPSKAQPVPTDGSESPSPSPSVVTVADAGTSSPVLTEQSEQEPAPLQPDAGVPIQPPPAQASQPPKLSTQTPPRSTKRSPKTSPIGPKRNPFGKTTIEITAYPWATVYLNGQNLGQTPIGPIEKPPGRYTIRLVPAPEINKAPYEKQIELEPKMDTRLHHNFDQ